MLSHKNISGLFLFAFSISCLLVASCVSKNEDPVPSTVEQPTSSNPQTSKDFSADEETAQAVLDTARLALQAGGFETALSKARSIRSRYPKALNAREDAILLIDSIEMLEAASRVARMDATRQTETDEATAIERAKAADKVAFFQEKLARDIATRKNH